MLPIHAVIEPLKAALAAGNAAVLAAPPGAGKTTVVPLALLEADAVTDADAERLPDADRLPDDDALNERVPLRVRLAVPLPL
ncbi:MAG: hypothetical protein ACOVKC_05035, partial [Brevundimonas sp.]